MADETQPINYDQLPDRLKSLVGKHRSVTPTSPVPHHRQQEEEEEGMPDLSSPCRSSSSSRSREKNAANNPPAVTPKEEEAELEASADEEAPRRSRTQQPTQGNDGSGGSPQRHSHSSGKASLLGATPASAFGTTPSQHQMMEEEEVAFPETLGIHDLPYSMLSGPSQPSLIPEPPDLLLSIGPSPSSSGIAPQQQQQQHDPLPETCDDGCLKLTPLAPRSPPRGPVPKAPHTAKEQRVRSRSPVDPLRSSLEQDVPRSAPPILDAAAAKRLKVEKVEPFSFRAGMRVEVRWCRTWLPATIVEDQRGTYVAVRWESDGSEMHVKVKEVRPLAPATLTAVPVTPVPPQPTPPRAADLPPPTAAKLLISEDESLPVEELKKPTEGAHGASPPSAAISTAPLQTQQPSSYDWIGGRPIVCYLTEMAKLEIEASPVLSEAFHLLTASASHTDGHPFPVPPLSVRVLGSVHDLTAGLPLNATLLFFVSTYQFKMRRLLLRGEGEDTDAEDVKGGVDGLHHVDVGGEETQLLPLCLLPFCLGVTPVPVQSLGLLHTSGASFPPRAMRMKDSVEEGCRYLPLPHLLRPLGGETIALIGNTTCTQPPSFSEQYSLFTMELCGAVAQRSLLNITTPPLAITYYYMLPQAAQTIPMGCAAVPALEPGWLRARMLMFHRFYCALEAKLLERSDSDHRTPQAWRSSPPPTVDVLHREALALEEELGAPPAIRLTLARLAPPPPLPTIVEGGKVEMRSATRDLVPSTQAMGQQGEAIKPGDWSQQLPKETPADPASVPLVSAGEDYYIQLPVSRLSAPPSPITPLPPSLSSPPILSPTALTSHIAQAVRLGRVIRVEGAINQHGVEVQMVTLQLYEMTGSLLQSLPEPFASVHTHHFVALSQQSVCLPATHLLFHLPVFVMTPSTLPHMYLLHSDQSMSSVTPHQTTL